MDREPIALKDARILIVEDDENNRIVVSRLLALIGADASRITLSEGDPVATLPAGQDGFDLVLLDLQMPRKDGYTVLGELRTDPRFARARIIALTANVMRQDVERARSAGFDGFIGKPIDGRRLGESMRRIMAGEDIWTS